MGWHFICRSDLCYCVVSLQLYMEVALIFCGGIFFFVTEVDHQIH